MMKPKRAVSRANARDPVLWIFTFLIMGFLPLVSHSLETPSTSTQDKNTNKKPLYWIDSMEPNIHYSAPGKSRMGMELVPVYPDPATTVSPPPKE